MAHILILDGDAAARDHLAQLAVAIEPDNTVSVFGLAEDALAESRRRPVDVAIAGHRLPDLDGADFIRRLRSEPGGGETVVLVLTGRDDRRLRIAALDAGASDFLRRPVDPHEFLTRARSALALRRSQQAAATSSQDRAFGADGAPNLWRAAEGLALIVEAAPALITVTDRQGRCVFVNRRLARMIDAADGELVGLTLTDMFGPEHGGRSAALDRLICESDATLPSFEEEIVAADGRTIHVLTSKTPLRDASGAIIAVQTTSLDITERKRAENHLRHLAHHDALTGLPNRSLLHERVRQEIAQSRRSDRKFALHLFDLDRFKAINDVLGHHIGDQLLKAVAERLNETVRETDVVARLGGDEFAILQPDIASLEDTAELARRIRKALAPAFMLDEQEVLTSASIGIAVFPDNGHDVDELLKNADLAMYRAKADGRDGFRVFASDMDATARAVTALESDLRRALVEEEFELYYQPQIDLSNGRIVGAEALIRWRRPGAGVVAPGEFLPSAEENGLIVPINNWVLRKACEEAASWPGLGLPDLRVAVNLSGIQFRKVDVGKVVADALKRTGLDPRRLELELTETILLQDKGSVVKQLEALRAIGVSFAIDDFGTGYSSLAYVKHFPVDRLKIDKSFVGSLGADANDAAIVRAIVNLGHSIGLEVVAEGVETAAQVAHLRMEGCDQAQGYYYGRPMRARTFVELVRRETLFAAGAGEDPLFHNPAPSFTFGDPR